MKVQHKIAIAVIVFVVLILVEIPFWLKSASHQHIAPDLSGGWRFIISLLLKGGGNPPNLLVIAIYLAYYD